MKINYLFFWIFLLILAIFIFLFLFEDLPPEVNHKLIADSSRINYPSDFNFNQTENDCGPFNVAAVVRAIKKENVSSAEFAEKIGWRMPNNNTLPWGVENQLKNHEINIEIPNLKPLTDDERIAFLEERLSQGKPIIILGGRDSIQHYVTIFGFNRVNNEYYCYDSLVEPWKDGLTLDKNGINPGNRNYSRQELLNFWSRGGAFGKFIWYAIVSSN